MRTQKNKYTATNRKARYTGTHPHIHGKEGVYYWNAEQDSYVFRPEAEDASKTDWYRIHRENLEDLE